MPTDGEPPKTGATDPELNQLLSELSFKEGLEKLTAEAEAAHAALKRLHALGTGRTVEIHKRYYLRECEKAQLRIELYKLPNLQL